MCGRRVGECLRCSENGTMACIYLSNGVNIFRSLLCGQLFPWRNGIFFPKYDFNPIPLSQNMVFIIDILSHYQNRN